MSRPLVTEISKFCFKGACGKPADGPPGSGAQNLGEAYHSAFGADLRPDLFAAGSAPGTGRGNLGVTGICALYWLSSLPWRLWATRVLYPLFHLADINSPRTWRDGQ